MNISHEPMFCPFPSFEFNLTARMAMTSLVATHSPNQGFILTRKYNQTAVHLTQPKHNENIKNKKKGKRRAKQIKATASVLIFCRPIT